MTSIQVGALPENIKTEAFQHVNPLIEGKEGNVKVEDLNNTSCMNNCRDNLLCVDEMPQPSKVDGSDDALGHGDDLVANHMDGDSTEYSSSVEGDFSDYEDGLENDYCNTKAESEIVDLPPILNQCNRLFRKKKLTYHWKEFIQPLMWRCRWIELRIKELQSQVARYDRELLAYGKKELEEAKPPLPQHSAAEQQTVASMGQKIYHRKKRRKIEEEVDVPSYISQHVIFSYFDNKPASGGLSIDEGFDAQEHNNTIQDDATLNLDWPVLEIKGNDKFLEQILFDIESSQVRVLLLTSQLRKLYENADFYSPESFIQGDTNYRPSLSPRCSPIHNEHAAPLETASTSLRMRDFENEDLVLSGSAVSSYGDAGHPDIIESTVDLLSIGNSSDHNKMGCLGTDVAEDILIHNQVAEESLHRFENVSRPLAKASNALKAEDGCAADHMVSSSETETDPEIAPAVGRKPTLKRCAGAVEFHLRRSKRKRKMRRTSPGSWNGEKIRRRKQPRKQGPH